MFVHLHTHSDYSFLDALPKVSDLVKNAKEKGFSAIALTDRGNMHGAIEFYKYCKGKDIQPILGCEMVVAPRSRFDKEIGKDTKRNKIVLLAENDEGYQHLLQLVTASFCEGFYYVPRIDMDLLKEKSAGLIAILPRAGGEITSAIESGDTETAKILYQKYQEIFSEDSLFVETTPRPNAENEELFQRYFREFLKETKALPVASNDIRYLEKDDNEVHDTLICMEYALQKNEPGRLSFLEHDLSLWTESQMQEYFADLPEALENTQKIANRCHYHFTFGENLIPSFPIPTAFANDGAMLRFLCEEGIRKRYGGKRRLSPFTAESFEEELKTADLSPITQNETNLNHDAFNTIISRLEYELSVIGSMGFNSYFLIVGDFVQWAKNNGIAVGPGRGSAAGAIVAYLMEITDLDPLKYSLFFERFLNPERISMPDIDIDFADNNREQVLDYVRKKYGNDHVAKVCTFGTMAARAAVKDVARALGVPFSEANELAKLIPERAGTTLDEALEESSELRNALEENEMFNTIYQTARKIEGNVRHISVHACAVMITPNPITQYCPIQPAPKDPEILITQFEAKPLEMLGLLKMDFLGLRNLTIMEDTLKLIKKWHSVEIDLLSIPMDDQKAFEMLTKGFTVGVFQLESAGMTRYLRELKPSRFEDLIAMVSLYRPGPMKFIPEYIAGKHGTKNVKYPHESLKGVLGETFGIAIYQEQILEIAKIFAGYTLGGADILRRAIGKKIASEMEAQRTLFINGAKTQGHEESLAAYIFDEVIVPFAGYGFNKSHAACYALIAYQTAYLKAYYPVEFMTALLISDADNTDRVIVDIEECRNLGIMVLPPSVQESDFSFTVIDEKTIRFGLNAIKGMGESVVEGLITARNINGRFKTFTDFLTICDPKIINKKSLEALAKSGALKDLEKTEKVLENIETILQWKKDNKEDNKGDQQDLFGMFDVEVEKKELTLPEAPEYSLTERLRLEKEVVGIYVSDHPLRGLKPYFENTRTPILQVVERAKRDNKKSYKLQGLLSDFRKVTTKKGDSMAIASLEDTSGKIAVVCFPKSFEKYGSQMANDVFAKITGKLDKKDGEWQVMIDELEGHDLGNIRSEAKEKGLLDENSTGFYTHRAEEEEEVISTADTEDVPIVSVWEIDLPMNVSAHQVQALKKLLTAHPGSVEVVFSFQGSVVPFPKSVEKNAELVQKVKEVIGG